MKSAVCKRPASILHWSSQSETFIGFKKIVFVSAFVSKLIEVTTFASHVILTPPRSTLTLMYSVACVKIHVNKYTPYIEQLTKDRQRKARTSMFKVAHRTDLFQVVHKQKCLKVEIEQTFSK